jgi:hypothetical protein
MPPSKSSPKVENNVVPSDWKDHVAKTLITLALGGLGTLMVASGSYLLTEDTRLEKFSAFESSSKETTARLKRRMEFCEAATSAHGRAVDRSMRLTDTLNADKSHIDFSKLRKVVEDGFQESLRDAGALAGYTPDSTGLPISFHESVNGFFKTDLELWRALDEMPSSLQNPKNKDAKRLEVQERLHSVLYAASLLTSSWQDMAKVTNSQAARDEELAKTIVDEANDERFMVHLAGHVLELSTALFLIIIFLLLLERLKVKVNQKR